MVSAGTMETGAVQLEGDKSPLWPETFLFYLREYLL